MGGGERSEMEEEKEIEGCAKTGEKKRWMDRY